MRRLTVLATTVLLVVWLLAACISTPSAGPTSPTAVPASNTTEADVVSLLARPMRLPSVAPGADCPAMRPRPLAAGEALYTNVYGTGPLYPLRPYLGADTTLRLNGRSPGPDGLYDNKVVWASLEAYSGPAVVRVGRLDGTGRGQVRLYYEPTASRGDAVVFIVLPGFPHSWPSGTFVSGPGCYAYQIDGLTFTEIIVFRVAP